MGGKVDSLLLFSDAQAITADAVSTNVVDLGAEREIGIGEPVAVKIIVDTAADVTTGDEDYRFNLQTDSAAAFSSPVNVISRIFLGAGAPGLASSLLVAGFEFYIPVPADTTLERALRLDYDVTGTTPSITVTAFLVCGSSGVFRAYPDGFTIS